MDQEKIGKFIAICRKEQNLTQEQLAEKLGVSSKSISRWENGRTLPDYSIIKDLCKTLNISINELFSGEKIESKNFKEIADNNLLNALENSSFTLKEKIKYYGDKWDKEHFFELSIAMIVIVGFIIYGFIKNNGIQFIFMIIGFTYGIWENNRKKTYIEKNAYKQIKDKK